MTRSVGELLRRAASEHRDRVALVVYAGDDAPDTSERAVAKRTEVTYAELDAGVLAAAGALVEAGLPAGSRVALIAQNGHAFVEAWLGTIYAGCTVVPMPILSATPEIAFRLADARCDVVIADAPRREAAERAVDRIARAIHVLDAAELGKSAVPLERPRAPANEDAMILYTSGTTGAPRGAAITHASLLAHTAALVEHALGLGPDDRVMGVLPLTHSYGIRMVVLATLHAGASAVLVPRFDAVSTLRLLTAECVTWLPVVPTMLAALAAARWTLGPGPNVHLAGRNSEAARFPALRWCLSAGAPLAEDVRVRAEARLGVEVRQGYGLTEATFCTIDAPPVPRTPGSVGRPVPGIEVRIAGADGRDAMPGDTGEVRVRGDNVMRGYVGDDDATQHVIRDGWLHTGDIGRLDVHGALFVVDRTKDLIIRGGNNVYPSEVEDVLARHPDVAEAAVVGRPDAYYGEEIVAVVVLRDGATLDPAALDAHAREHLSPVKVPRELAVVDALPLGPSRKVLKRELREMLAAGKLEVRRVR